MRSLVIDPGHGGRDPGAVRPGVAWSEAQINMAVAGRLVDALRDAMYPPCRMALTRAGDADVGLHERAWLANTQGGVGLFLSIHCNAAENPTAHGAEAWISRGCYEVTRVAAQTILTRFLARTGFRDRGVRVAPGPQRRSRIHVLSATHMPAVLLELGFLSNDEQARLLTSPAWQMLAARAIAAGVHEFFDERDGAV